MPRRNDLSCDDMEKISRLCGSFSKSKSDDSNFSDIINNDSSPCTDRIEFSVNEGCIPRYECPSVKCYPSTSTFNSMIVPLSELNPCYSDCPGTVQFIMRRKNKTVTLQWEPFNGIIGANGITCLTVVQPIYNVPPYPITFPIYIDYKSNRRLTSISIDPHAKCSNVKIYLNEDMSSRDVYMGDVIYVPASAITWLIE